MAFAAPALDRLVPEAAELALGALADGVIVRATDYPRDARVPPHRHAEHQLVHAISGVMTVQTGEGAWVTPPGFAVWMPARREHEIRLSGVVRMRTLYVDPRLAPCASDRPQVVPVPVLLRELLSEAARAVGGAALAPAGANQRLAGVILDQIAALRPAALHLPLPTDPRARRVAEGLIDNPADRRSAAEIARTAGVSERSLARLFMAETGLSFGQWRRRRTVLAAVARLAEGEPVTTVAYDLGYASLSAFSAMVRRETGRTPRALATVDVDSPTADRESFGRSEP